MKTATVFTIATGEPHGYAWKWRCATGTVTSAGTFPFYYDCITDARKHGYEVDVTRAHGVTAPGGAGFALERTGE
jgi:hypothetical protein